LKKPLVFEPLPNKYAQFFGLYYNIQNNTQFRQLILDDVSSQEPYLKKLEKLCLDEIKSLTKRVKEYSKDDAQFKKQHIESIQQDSRNAYQFQKAQQTKKQLEVKGGLATTQTGSIFINRKKTALDTAMSYLIEEEKPAIPLQDPSKEVKPAQVPSVLLPKQETPAVTLSMKLDKEKSTIPGAFEFLKALSNVIEKVPYGRWFLQDTILRESMLVFRHMQLSIWACYSMIH
jgi:hypothetical protein